MSRARVLLATIVTLHAGAAAATTSTVPDDFGTIQAALDAAVAGDTVRVRAQPAPYHEKIVFPRSGNAEAGYITLEAFPGNEPVLDGTGVPGADMVLIADRSYVRLIGFDIRNNLGVDDGSGVRVLGSGSHIEIRDNRIHDIHGRHAMGITVYGTGVEPISDLIIDGNEIYDCEPYSSEALTLNGNVSGFQVTNNVVRDVNNIGIDFIGGETDIQPDPTKVARNGVCRGNQVRRAREPGGGFAAGIYIDGGRDIVIENNVVTESDLGIEVGAENRGIVTEQVVVRNNVLRANEKACLVFGGFKATAGRVRNSRFLNNTCHGNDTLGSGFGELWIQFAEDNEVRHNIFHATAQGLLVLSEDGNVDNVLDYNLFFTDAGPSAATFVWQGVSYPGFAAYRVGSGQDAHSLLADPQLLDPGAGDVHLAATSPAVNGGDPAFTAAPGERDLDGAPRVSGGRVDIGADEATCGDGVLDPGEICDDGDLVDGDGCDRNCTPTGCGNGIVTAGEACDGGPCCSAACEHATAGTPCDDGDLCSNGDACDGSGECAGEAVPLTPCRGGKSTLVLKTAPNPERAVLTWKLLRGDATTPGELGDPVTGDGYVLCVYDASAAAALRLSARLPAGSAWRARGDGFAYRSRSRLPDGVMSARLTPGTAGRTKVLVKAKGAQLPLPPLSTLELPLTVQLRGEGGGCWGASFSTPRRATETVFTARGD